MLVLELVATLQQGDNFASVMVSKAVNISLGRGVLFFGNRFARAFLLENRICELSGHDKVYLKIEVPSSTQHGRYTREIVLHKSVSSGTYSIFRGHLKLLETIHSFHKYSTVVINFRINSSWIFKIG